MMLPIIYYFTFLSMIVNLFECGAFINFVYFFIIYILVPLGIIGPI